jgi:hypothetical protein
MPSSLTWPTSMQILAELHVTPPAVTHQCLDPQVAHLRPNRGPRAASVGAYGYGDTIQPHSTVANGHAPSAGRARYGLCLEHHGVAERTARYAPRRHHPLPSAASASQSSAMELSQNTGVLIPSGDNRPAVRPTQTR